MPLDSDDTSQLIIPIDRNYDAMKPKIAQFYKFLEEEKEFDKKL